MRTARLEAPPTQPSSAAAAEWPIAGRNASLIISRFNASDDSYLRRPGHRLPPLDAPGKSRFFKTFPIRFGPKFVRDGPLRAKGRCATRQIAALPRGDAGAGSLRRHALQGRARSPFRRNLVGLE